MHLNFLLQRPGTLDQHSDPEGPDFSPFASKAATEHPGHRACPSSASASQLLAGWGSQCHLWLYSHAQLFFLSLFPGQGIPVSCDGGMKLGHTPSSSSTDLQEEVPK